MSEKFYAEMRRGRDLCLLNAFWGAVLAASGMPFAPYASAVLASIGVLFLVSAALSDLSAALSDLAVHFLRREDEKLAGGPPDDRPRTPPPGGLVVAASLRVHVDSPLFWLQTSELYCTDVALP